MRGLVPPGHDRGSRRIGPSLLANDVSGLYSCPLAGPAPCVPTLIAAANLPTAITVDKGRVFSNERGNASLMVYAPPGPPTVFRSDATSATGLANCIKPTTLWNGAPQPTDITGDAEAFYSVTYGGSIWKVVKP